MSVLRAQVGTALAGGWGLPGEHCRVRYAIQVPSATARPSHSASADTPQLQRNHLINPPESVNTAARWFVV